MAPAPGRWVGRPAQPQPRVCGPSPGLSQQGPWGSGSRLGSAKVGLSLPTRGAECGGPLLPEASEVEKTALPGSPRATLVPSDLLAADSHVSAHSTHRRGGTVTVTGQPRDHKPGNAGKSVAFSPGIQAAVSTRIFGAAPHSLQPPRRRLLACAACTAGADRL